jgi:hypothetical protein
LPDIIIQTDRATAPDRVVPPAAGIAHRKATETFGSPPERIMQTPLDRPGSNDRKVLLLGLFLLSASDPRLRFGY